MRNIHHSKSKILKSGSKWSKRGFRNAISYFSLQNFIILFSFCYLIVLYVAFDFSSDSTYRKHKNKGITISNSSRMGSHSLDSILMDGLPPIQLASDENYELLNIELPELFLSNSKHLRREYSPINSTSTHVKNILFLSARGSHMLSYD